MFNKEKKRVFLITTALAGLFLALLLVVINIREKYIYSVIFYGCAGLLFFFEAHSQIRKKEVKHSGPRQVILFVIISLLMLSNFFISKM